MELKEFSHKGEAIEKEIKKEFQFMGRTIKKRRVGPKTTVTAPTNFSSDSLLKPSPYHPKVNCSRC